MNSNLKLVFSGKSIKTLKIMWWYSKLVIFGMLGSDVFKEGQLIDEI